MMILWTTTLARAASPAGDAAVDGVLAGGGALVGELALGFPIAAATIAGCGPVLGGSTDNSACVASGAVLSLVGYAGGAVGGAALGALPAHVRPGRAALGAAIPVGAGATLLFVGAAAEVDPLAYVGVGTMLLGAPMGAAIAAATDREDRDHAAPTAALSFAPRLGGSPGAGAQLTLSGRF